jgi:hypothetical protein
MVTRNNGFPPLRHPQAVSLRVVLPYLSLAVLLTQQGMSTAMAEPGSEYKKLEQRIREAADLPGEPAVFEAAGISREDLILRTIENREPISGNRKRMVIVAGLDGNDRGVDAALGAVRWLKTAAPAAVRAEWSVSVLPCGNPEGWQQLKPTNNSGGKPAVNYPPADGFFADKQNPEARYVWRWVAFQAPDVVLEVRGGNRVQWWSAPAFPALGAAVGAQPLVGPDTFAMAFSQGEPSGLAPLPVLAVQARAADGPAVLQAALRAAASLPTSPLRRAVQRRLARKPLEVAGVLARRYPQAPSIAYIPAVAWVNSLRLAAKTGEVALIEKVRSVAAPYLQGQKKPVEGTPDVARLAGSILFAELAVNPAVPEEERQSARKLALEGAAQYRPDLPDQPARLGKLWTDDMFMQHTLIGRAGQLSGDSSYFDLMGRTLRHYISRIQRRDGLFIHAVDGPHGWGRGNGFAALGLMEALTYFPKEHPDRAPIHAAYVKQMTALRGVQAPEGTWRQVIDHPESYREVTATAMNLAAMARGVRLGWLGPEFRPTVDRAWSGLLARIFEDGALADVCTGTGAGPTLRYYLERSAIFGPDDRGGAMCLLAAMEVAELP